MYKFKVVRNWQANNLDADCPGRVSCKGIFTTYVGFFENLDKFREDYESTELFTGEKAITMIFIIGQIS